MDKIPEKLKSLYCLVTPEYKSSSANRKFNCKCESCKTWNTLRNFYRKNTNSQYKEKQNASARKWAIYNPDAKRRSEAKRRSLKIGNGHSEYTEVDVLNTYGLSCHLCGVDVDLSASRLAGRGNWKYGLNLDHVIPVSKGGSDTLENVRPSHVLCNIKKGNR